MTSPERVDRDAGGAEAKSPGLALDAPFDQYSRYRACAHLLEKLAGSEPVTVLDVGSGESCLLGRLLPQADITYVDPLLNGRADESRSISGDIFTPQLDGRCFDYVLSIDTLEHVAPERRPGFLDRLGELARHGVILACPCADAGDAVSTDRCVNELYRRVYGRDYLWLAEHFRHGLPNLADIVLRFEKQGWHVQRTRNGHTPWHKRLLPFVICALETGSLAAAAHQLSGRFNENLASLDHQEPAYRQIVIALRQPAKALAPALPSPQEWQEACRRWAEIEVEVFARAMQMACRLGGELSAAERELSQARWAVEALRGSLSWRITAPLRDALAWTERAAARSAPGRWLTRAVLGGLGVDRDSVVRARAARLHLDREPPPQPVRKPQIALEEIRKRGLALRAESDPLVSIIIPVHGQYEYTYECLRSIAQNTAEPPFEVIVVDDASRDATAEVLAAVPGVRVLRNPENRGFIRSCKRGAREARGEFLVFLNNDTVVTPGWLRELHSTFHHQPRAGIVGAQLSYPDGRLQEAGGVIFADGTGWNYGRFDDPRKPQYNYLCEVDYCSGACLMIRSDLFREVGGFDERYAPAYYEDVDLAFQVRSRGFEVLYQPCAKVIHFEGVSSGTDPGAGVKRHQALNRRTFVEKWHEVLARSPLPGTPAEQARDRYFRHRALVVDHRVPTPDQDAGSLRMFHLLLLLRERMRVTFLADDLLTPSGYVEALQARGIEVLTYPFVTSVRDHLGAAGAGYDLVLLSRAEIADRYVDDVRRLAAKAHVLFDTVDLHFVRELREAEVMADAGRRARALRRKEQELRAARRAHCTVVVSPAEAKMLCLEDPHLRIRQISTIQEVRGCARTFAERRHIVFLAGFGHPPNVDAFWYFVQEIFPRVREALPGVEVHVIGSAMPSSIRNIAEPGVVPIGFAPDLGVHLDSCRLSVAPLRFGAGIKGKINMSMSYGVPVVATSVAVEGMHLNDREDVLIGDAPEIFADAVIELHSDEQLWTRLSRGALENVRRYFSIDAARRSLDLILTELLPDLRTRPPNHS